MKFVWLAVFVWGCGKKVTPAQCETLIEHYAELVVREHNPNARPELIAAERERERREAHTEDGFKNCPTEVQPSEFACAMKANSPDAVLKCLE